MRLLANCAIEHLGDRQHAGLTKGIDIIGDIAILKLPEGFQDNKHSIANKLLDLVPSIKVVMRQTAPIGSLFRTRKLEWLAGEHRTETVHSEFGCKYKVNVASAYFSPRLSHERKRIADLVSAGECLVNFYAGVGCFSIMAAKHSNTSRIYSFDINPAAVHYHALNNSLNKVQNTIDLICGDADRLVSISFVGVADRVLLPLPERALRSLPTAKLALKNQHGMVHCYVFVGSSRRSEAGKCALSETRPLLKRIGVTEENTEAHVVRSVGHCYYQVCLDIQM